MEKSEYNKILIEKWRKDISAQDALIVCMLGFKEDGGVSIQTDSRMTDISLAISFETTARLLREKHNTLN